MRRSDIVKRLFFSPHVYNFSGNRFHDSVISDEPEADSGCLAVALIGCVRKM